MRIGYRVVRPEEVGCWKADIIQISVYKGSPDALAFMEQCAERCRKEGIPYVVHPVRYSLLDVGDLDPLKAMAECSGEALIVHDEKDPGGGRLSGDSAVRFRGVLETLGSLAHVSIENSTDSADAPWFWDNFAPSVTLDMGHMESVGLDSVDFIASLDGETAGKVRYVHMHRNNGMHGGITDHWPLAPGCRELWALKEFVSRNPDVGVLLEINETGHTGESLALLRDLRDEAGI